MPDQAYLALLGLDLVFLFLLVALLLYRLLVGGLQGICQSEVNRSYGDCLQFGKIAWKQAMS
jgi:hypothetical protein